MAKILELSAALRHCLVPLVLALGASPAFAAGPIGFGAVPAVTPLNADSALPTPATPMMHGPGWIRAIASPVTPAESDAAIKARVLPEGLISPLSQPGARTSSAGRSRALSTGIGGDGAALGPASIAELARSLKNDPDLIYEYVVNNIEYYPIWGVQKGPIGTLLDNKGTAFDQASLMVALLRQAGYSASYLKGGIKLTAQQIRDWLGIDTANSCAVRSYFAQGRTPIRAVTPNVSCPGSTAPLVDISIDHVWVKATIGASTYVFDPSFKTHTLKPAIDLVGATGYSQSSYMTMAKSGATTTPDYVQSINRSGIRTQLNTYATSLSTWLRQNKPAADLGDVLGGKVINPKAAGNIRQTALAYQDTGVVPTEWADIDDAYRPILRVQYQGIDKSYTSDAIYGRRLALTFNGSNLPVLTLDGVTQATGSAIVPDSVTPVTFTVTHPAGSGANQTFTQQIKAKQGNVYVVSNGWGRWAAA